MSQFFAPGGQSMGVSTSASVLPVNIQEWFPLGLTGWISLQPKGLSRVFFNTTVQIIIWSLLTASKIQCWQTYKRASALVAEMGLTLASMHSWEIHIRIVYTRGQAASKFLSGPRLTGTAVPEMNFSDLHWWPDGNSASESTGPIARISTVHTVLRKVPTTVCFVSLYRSWKEMTENNHRWASPKKENSVASLPVGELQSHLLHTLDKNHS